MLVALGPKHLIKILGFPEAHGTWKRHEAIRNAEVTIKFGNLVLEHEVIAERVPSEI